VTSPTEAGIDLFGLSCSFGFIAIVAGVVVKKTGNYVIPTYVGWVLAVVGAGLLTTLHADSSMAKSIGFQLVIGSGVGIIQIISMYPILASIPVTQNAPAMALHVFLRNLGNVSPSLSIHVSTLHDLLKNFPMFLDLGCHERRCHFAE
jgi:fucose permease